jgi:hypothetical protein
LEKLILEKGKALGVQVFLNQGLQGDLLYSLGSPAAYEYSDGAAATGHGNIHPKGVFEISV